MIMKILFFSTKDFEKAFIVTASNNSHKIHFVNEPLSVKTAELAKGYDCISIFTADDASTGVLNLLSGYGVKYIAIRAAGYDNVDLQQADLLGIKVANVPEYSPYAIAEHTVALMLALNRRLVIANDQVHQYNFTLDKLIGFDVNKKTIGLIGTGRIGSVVAKIMHGFGCRILAYDIIQNSALKEKYGVQYGSLQEICSAADIITLHTPLNPNTKYLLNKELMSVMKKGVMVINTSRGGVINTADLLEFLRNGTIAYCGIDVYEKERGLFFYDHSGKPLNDPMLSELLTMPNVMITPHQAFATNEALDNISTTTFESINSWNANAQCANEIHSESPVKR